MSKLTKHDAFQAIDESDFTKLKKCLEKQVMDINEVNQDGFSLLGLAVYYTNEKMVNFICNQPKVNVNLKRENNTPLEDLLFYWPVKEYEGKKPILTLAMTNIAKNLLCAGAVAEPEKFKSQIKDTQYYNNVLNIIEEFNEEENCL